MKIVVVGSTNLDLVATTPALPRPGETVLGHRFSTVPGGKGANQAIAAARAGADALFLGAVGDDPFADQLRANLAEAGVDLSLLRIVPGPSGVALIAVDDDGENSIVVAPGANAHFTELTEEDRSAIASAGVLLLQLEIPLATVIEAATVARAAGVQVLLNAAPAQSLPAELLAVTDMLIVNTLEAEILLGYADSSSRRSPSASARGMLAYGLLEEMRRLVPKVVLTAGADGAYYTDQKGGWLHVPTPRVEAVDTTAAGDAFVGALAVALSMGKQIGPALSWACAAGAICVTRAGAGGSLATFAEIDGLAAH
ncbi:ribokinase [Allocatelliglobosispora scoriae]|uniref:Ribokinase n=1 Tax=Allocatelliglobosispora scoriae TaxID=643052 RepID=A0A841BSJ6_9ACTN|nr:ribokinase [Allocatelliglobosispora scoriae]MBB5869781.1 ribokinase [Allocatelliglobosispora scoriae]